LLGGCPVAEKLDKPAAPIDQHHACPVIDEVAGGRRALVGLVVDAVAGGDVGDVSGEADEVGIEVI
jgi:hypothetical protein